MAGRAITGGSAAHRVQFSRTPKLLRSFSVYAAALWLLAVSPTLQAQKNSRTPIGSSPTMSGPDFGRGATAPLGEQTDPFEALYGSPPMAPMPLVSDRLIDSEGCNSWTESGVRSPTVSVARLAVPGKASSEYRKGCGAYKDKNLEQAERHLHKAIHIYPSYPAAWVVLGQVLDAHACASN